MFSASPAFASAASRFQAGAYRQVAVDSSVHGTADPHRLVVMLFEGWFEAVNQARGAMQAGDIATKCAAVDRAIRIVQEGLCCALDLKNGGALARNLQAVYEYVIKELTMANLRNDTARLEHCVTVMRPLQEAWFAIRPGAPKLS